MENTDKPTTDNAKERVPQQKEAVPAAANPKQAAESRIGKAGEKVTDAQKRVNSMEEARNEARKNLKQETRVLTLEDQKRIAQSQKEFVAKQTSAREAEMQKIYAEAGGENFVSLRAENIKKFNQFWDKASPQSKDKTFQQGLIASLTREKEVMTGAKPTWESASTDVSGMERSRYSALDTQVRYLTESIAEIDKAAGKQKQINTMFEKAEKEKRPAAAKAPADGIDAVADLTEEQKKYVSDVKALRAATEEYGDGARNYNVDGLHIQEYWKERMPAEVKYIKDNQKIWSQNPALAKNERARLIFLESSTATDTKVTQERKENFQAQEKRVREVLSRQSNEPMVVGMADPFLLEKVFNEMRNTKTSLSREVMDYGEKMVKFEELHQWMDDLKPNPMRRRTMFPTDETPTSGTFDDRVLMHGANIRLALETGELTKEDVREYLDKVKNWTNKNIDRFMEIFESRLPTLIKGPDGKPLWKKDGVALRNAQGELVVIPPQIKMITPEEVEADQKQAEKENRAATKETLKKSTEKGTLKRKFFSEPAKQMGEAAATADPDSEEGIANADLLDAIAGKAEGVEEVDKLLSLPTARYTGGTTMDRLNTQRMRTLILAGKFTRQDAIQYFMKEKDMTKEQAQEEVKKLEKRIDMPFKDEDATDTEKKELSERVTGTMSLKEQNKLYNLLTYISVDPTSVMKTPLFTDAERALVQNYMVDPNNIKIELIPMGVLRVVRKVEKFKPLQDWNLKPKGRLTRDPLRRALQTTLTPSDVYDYMELVVKTADKKWYNDMKKDLNNYK